MPRSKAPAPAKATTEGKASSGQASKLQMADIARLANVSVSTVSRALANHPRLSEETRRRVHELARSLNYQVNVGAQMLRGKALQTVAVAFPYHPDQRGHFKDPFFLSTLGAIGDALIDSGHSMLVVPVEASRPGALTHPHETGQAIGTILLGQETNHHLFNELAVRRLPFVVWGARLPDQLYCTVGSDNILGGRQATEHLLQCGARRIAFFGDTSLAELGQRHVGYLQAHEARRRKAPAELRRAVPFSEQEVRAEVDRMIAEGVKFDAVFACSDVMALTVIHALKGHGLRVPEDIMVVGFDDIAAAANSNPPLTTVRQSIEVAGRQLVTLLLDKLEGKPVESQVLATELIVRGSTRPAI